MYTDKLTINKIKLTINKYSKEHFYFWIKQFLQIRSNFLRLFFKNVLFFSDV